MKPETQKALEAIKCISDEVRRNVEQLERDLAELGINRDEFEDFLNNPGPAIWQENQNERD